MSSSRAHAIIALIRDTRQVTAQTRKMAEATISKPAAQTSKGHDYSRASATSAMRRATRGQTAQRKMTASTTIMPTTTTSAVERKKSIMLMWNLCCVLSRVQLMEPSPLYEQKG